MRRVLRFAIVFLALALALLGGLAAASAPGARNSRLGPGGPAQGTATPTATVTPPPACGLYWRVVASPNPGPYDISYGIAAAAANDIWVVGTYQNGSTLLSLTEHWDGSVWSLVLSPSPGSTLNFLSHVAVVTSNDVWAAGSYTTGNLTQTLIEHWNGSAWLVVPSPNQGSGNNVLTGVAVVAATDIWAVGNYVSGGVTQTLTEHWNGTQWSIVASPNLGSGNNHLNEVTALATNNLWAVGDAGTQSLVEHWNGTAWSVVASPNVGTTSNSLHSVAAVAAIDIWSVGSSASGGFMQSLVEHWNGTAWSVVASANGAGDTDLRGVAAVSANDIWSVGYAGPGAPAWEPFSEHWNGSAWSVVPMPPGPLPHNATPWGVVAIAADDIWSAGDDSNTMIHHYGDPCAGGTVTPTRTAGPPTVTRTPGPATSTPAPSSTPLLPTATAPPATRTPAAPTATPRPPSPTPGGPTTTPVPTDTLMPPTHTPLPPPTNTAGPSPTPCSLSFSDVHPSDYFYQPVLYLACHDVVSGYADGTFRPYNDTTRSQMVKLVVLGFGQAITTPVGGAYRFHDVPSAFPFFSYIETAAAAGIVSGYTCGGPGEPCDSQNRPYFRPYAPVTRGQVAKFDVLGAGWPLLDPASRTFADVLPGTAFYPFVETAAARSVISGYACGGAGEPCGNPPRPYFRQYANAIRGQIAKIVYLSILSP